jgi:histidine triad (HIT) family protein
MISVANDIARKEEIFKSGYRLIINSGREGGQVVPHLHMHILGGRELAGQMG